MTAYRIGGDQVSGLLRCGISARLTAALGHNEKFRLFGLMSASAGSSGHNAENAYRRLVPLPDLSRCSKNLLMMLQHRLSLWAGLAATSFGASSTVLGSRIVKVEPRPGSLSTVMSPPIIWQKRC